jgi:branched-chain amino acid transport system permease protein
VDVFLTLVIGGIGDGALYFLIAAGLTLIFGLLQVINFAHGGLYLWGAYMATFLYAVTHQFWLALIVGAGAGAVLGIAMERGLLGRLYHHGTNQILITMGVMLILSEFVKVPFGVNGLNAPTPSFLSHSWLVGHVVLVEYQWFTIVVGAMVYLVLHWLLRRTRLGMVIRAGVENAGLVEACGIPIRNVFTAVFALGAALAGFAGALAGPYFGSVTPGMGLDMQLTAFIIVVIGGMGSVQGALVGSLLVGVVTSFMSFYFPSLSVLVTVLVMAVVLLVRPQGWFGEARAAA